MILTSAVKVLKRIGYTVTRNRELPLYEPDVENIIRKASPYTMTSRERMYALYQSIKYIHQNKIYGDVVECGVWQGGSSMVAALTLKMLGDTSRELFLYDTFEGMSEPGENDVDFRNNKMKEVWSNVKQNDTVMCYSTLNEVKQNMSSTGYPSDRVHYIKGKVEDTIPQNIPGRISLLRLDTDWYESTKHELEHLYPRLAVNGVLIIDDYGHWKGARKAVDEYFAKINIHPLLNAIDYSGRIMIKTE